MDERTCKGNLDDDNLDIYDHRYLPDIAKLKQINMRIYRTGQLIVWQPVVTIQVSMTFA